MKIYQVKDKNSDAEWFYRSMIAICKDNNIVDMTREHLSVIKKKEGFPIERKDWIIHLRHPKGMNDIIQ